MPGVTITSHKPEDIYQDQKRLYAVMKGEINAFCAQTPSKKDISPDGKSFKQEAKGLYKKALAAYDLAATRDAYYCVAGRKYMRRKAVVGKLTADLRRIVALKQIEVEQQ